MTDHYDYDFSDDERDNAEKQSFLTGGDGDESPVDKRQGSKVPVQEEDEQHTQKINGMVESYQKQLSDLQERLEQEQAAHEATKSRLQSASNTSGGGGSESAELAKEIERLQASQREEKRIHELELARVKKEASSGPAPAVSAPPKPSVPKSIKKEINSMCLVAGIEPPGFSEDDLTEKDCVALLKQLAAAKNKKAEPQSPPRMTVRQGTGLAAAPAVQNSEELQQRIKSLEEELRLALGAAEDIRALKAKVIQLVDRLRAEKEERIKGDAEVKRYSKKMEMLGDHIEKLMLHLKHEAGVKVKTSDQLRESEKRQGVMHAKCINLQKKIAAKDRLIAELREGSKILEDQLRLMDEKYLELRTKLDYTRDVGVKKVKKAQKIASELRVKFALAGNTTLLDHIAIPSAQTAPAGGLRIGGMDSFDYNRSNEPGPLGAVKNGGKKTVTIATKGSSAWDTAPALREEDEPRVLEKVRLLQGGKTEWTEDKVRALLDK